MRFEEFKATLELESVPEGLAEELSALWHDARGDWDGAHDVVQPLRGVNACRVHAYLHRKEGDEGNAGYWYAKAGTPTFDGSLDDEWEALVRDFLEA